MKEALLKKIENREITVGVVGLGYVGLPLAVEKAKAGFKTIGFDVQEEKVNLVNEGHNYIGDVVDSDLKKLVEAEMLSATTDFSFVKDVDFIAICVPTPLDKHQQPDISYGYQSVGSYRCCENKTVWIPGILSWPGAWGALHSVGSVLPFLESKRIWIPHFYDRIVHDDQ